MRIVRFSDGNNPRYGLVKDDSSRIFGLKGDPLFSQVEMSGEVFDLDEVRLLSPVIPRSKVVGVGKNYYAEPPKKTDEPITAAAPLLFLKPNTSVIGPDDPIVLPPWAHRVVHEAELAVVIKTLAKDIPVDQVDDIIFGYTVGNDVSARDVQEADGQWARGKSFDTACPLGPWITVDPELDIDNLLVTSTVNGEPCQSSSTSEMITPVRELVSFISHVFTLLPGDVILTGTPSGVSQIEAGDRVDVAVSGIGTLSNPVVRR